MYNFLPISNYIYLIKGVVVIEAHEQNTAGLKFKVPLVPYLPALSILCNVELMANLNFLTWIRFILWMAIGKKYNYHRNEYINN